MKCGLTLTESIPSRKPSSFKPTTLPTKMFAAIYKHDGMVGTSSTLVTAMTAVAHRKAEAGLFNETKATTAVVVEARALGLLLVTETSLQGLIRKDLCLATGVRRAALGGMETDIDKVEMEVDAVVEMEEMDEIASTTSTVEPNRTWSHVFDATSATSLVTLQPTVPRETRSRSSPSLFTKAREPFPSTTCSSTRL